MRRAVRPRCRQRRGRQRLRGRLHAQPGRPPRAVRRTASVCCPGRSTSRPAIPSSEHRPARTAARATSTAIAGQCTFRVGVCLNRLGLAACSAGDLRALDLRLHVERPEHAAAAEAHHRRRWRPWPRAARSSPTAAASASSASRARSPTTTSATRDFGVGDGLCDIGTGVLFLPPLEPVAQTSTCTPSIDVVVAVGSRLKLPALARTGSARRDKDTLRLVCLP